MSPIKNVWYEVRYVDSIPLSIIGSSGPVQSVIRCKNFKDRKKAQQFFDELSNDYNKWLVLCEESVCDVVYSKN